MLFGSVRKPLLPLCILGLKTFVSMQAGKTSQKITQKHIIPCPTLRKHKAFYFLFFPPFVPVIHLRPEKHIIHASELTWRFHLHQQQTYVIRQTGVTHPPGGCVTGRADRKNVAVMAAREGLVILKDSAIA